MAWEMRISAYTLFALLNFVLASAFFGAGVGILSHHIRLGIALGLLLGLVFAVLILRMPLLLTF